MIALVASAAHRPASMARGCEARFRRQDRALFPEVKPVR
jgi:hypothetical protein